MARSRRAQRPSIELEPKVSGETARQVICGIETFVAQLDELFEQVTQTKSSGRYSELSELADLCLKKDVSLPSGLRLALQAISGDDWQKPFRELKRAVANRTPSPPQKDLRPLPGMWGDETSKIWAEEEADEFQREDRAKERREHYAVEAAYLDLRDLLCEVVQIAESRLLGQVELNRRRRRMSQAKTDETLRNEYLENSEFIEFLKREIQQGNQHAHRVARDYFKHSALKKRLNLGHGAVSNSQIYKRLKHELQLDTKLARKRDANFDVILDRAIASGNLPAEATDLLSRIEDSVADGTISSNWGDVLSKWVLDDPNATNRLGEIEEMLRQVRQGERSLDE